LFLKKSSNSPTDPTELDPIPYGCIGKFHEYQTWKILHEFIVLQNHLNGSNAEYIQCSVRHHCSTSIVLKSKNDERRSHTICTLGHGVVTYIEVIFSCFIQFRKLLLLVIKVRAN
jgi:hypothetical protein